MGMVPFGRSANPSAGSVEKKYFDRFYYNSTDKNTTSYVTTIANDSVGILLNGVGSGTGEDQRVGNKITIHSIDFDFNMSTNGMTRSATEGHVCIDVALVLFGAANAAAFSALKTQILQHAGKPQSMVNMSFKNNLKIILRKSFLLSYTDATGGYDGQGHNSAHIDTRRALGFVTQFTGASGTAHVETTLQQNALYLVVTCNTSGEASADKPSNFRFFSRIRYTDA